MAETIVVVGATGEMGKIVCQTLCNDWDVLAVARDTEKLIALQHSLPKIRICSASIDDDSAIDIIQAALTGPVKALVHGPGVTTAGGIASAPTAAVVDAVNIKVGGLIRIVRAAEPYLQRGSRIIAVGGHYGFEPTAYAATAGVANAALANAVRQMSWAYGERGITSHLLAPGPADTPRLHRVAAARAEREGTSSEQVLDEMRSESAINSLTDVAAVAWAVKLLLDPHADALAGGTLFMDSGRRRGLP